MERIVNLNCLRISGQAVADKMSDLFSFEEAVKFQVGSIFATADSRPSMFKLLQSTVTRSA